MTEPLQLAPVILFVYNRPWHTKQTVQALQKNDFAAESDLFIFSDGPKNPEAIPEVQEVRDFIEHISGFKSVSIVERAENFGLANSIIIGVTKIIREHGRVIVMEDDLITSPYFLKYINDALNLYEQEARVVSIHGYTYPVKQNVPETFFLRGADCWGWATWEREWELFEPDGRKLLESLKNRNLESEFSFCGSYDYMGMLDAQVRGENDSWAIRWYASAFLKNMLTLYPGKSLVLNIGNDNSGTHCKDAKYFSGEIADRPIKIGGIEIKENSQVRSAIVDYFLSNKDSMLERIIRKVRHAGKSWGL